MVTPSTPYHRLARTGTHRWWRPIVGTAFIILAGAVLALAGFLVFTAAATIAGRPEDADGVATFGARGDLAMSFLAVAALLPATLLAARWIQRRRAGTLSSVTGRLRRRWLLVCLPVAFGAIASSLGAGFTLATVTGTDVGLGDPLAGWGSFLASMLVLLLVVPPQAAAEEYLTRGWLLQGIGAWFRRPWVPIMVQAVVFAALHGWGTPWGFADLLVFGVVAGYLTVRTGGLEAAIALHVMNNLVSSVIAAAYNDLGLDQTAADMPWQFAVMDLPALLAYTGTILWLARRRGIASVTHTQPIVAEPAVQDRVRSGWPGRARPARRCALAATAGPSPASGPGR